MVPVVVDGDLGARAEGGQAGEPALAVDRLHSPRQRAPRDAAHAPVAAHPGRPADPGLREGLAGLHQRRHPRGDEGVEVDPGRRDGRDPGQDQPVVGGCGDQVGLAARDVGGAARLRVVGRVGGDHHHLSAGVLDRDLPHAVVGGDLRGRRAGRRHRVRGGGVAVPVGQGRTAEPLDLVPAAGDGELETGPRAAVLPAVGRAQGVELAVEGRRLLGVDLAAVGLQVESTRVEVLGEHVVVVAQHLVHPDLGGLGRRHRGGRGGRRGGRRGRGRRGRLGRRRGRSLGRVRAGHLGRVGAVGAGRVVMGPRAGPVVRGGPAGGRAVRAVRGVLGRDSVVRVLAAGVTGQVDGVLVAAGVARLPPSRLLVRAAVGGRRAVGRRGQRARWLGDQRRLGRLRVTGREAGDAEHDGQGRGGRAGHRHAHPEQPATAAAYVVLGRHERDADPAGQRVQLLFEEPVGGVGHRRPPRWLVSVRSAVRSFSRAAEVWLFTVPGLTPRSAAVSSTESPQ